MAKGSHVPKFGNWDGDNVPYTAYFESARRGKASGLRMNPNDPEENPEAFMFAEFANGSDSEPNSVPASARSSHDKPSSHVKYNTNQGRMVNGGHRRNTSDLRQKSPSDRMSIASESGSEKSHSDRAILHPPNHQRRKSERKKSISENSSGFFQPSAASMKLMSGSNPSDDLSIRSASVPKFGAWDEKDPKSGEGFTVIFNKVKEEKQIAATKFPPAQPQTNRNSASEDNHTRSKIFCCLF